MSLAAVQTKGHIRLSRGDTFREGFPLRVFNYHQPDDILHCHDFHELVVVRKGSGFHVIDEEEYSISRGDAFLIRPGHVHTYRNVHGLEIVNILYWPEQLELPLYDLKNASGYYIFFEAKPQMRGRYREKGRLTFTHEQLRQAEEIIAGMILEQQGHADGREFFLRVSFLRLVGLICRAFSEIEEGQPNELACASRAIRFFEQNYHHAITLAEVARVCGKSSSSIVRLFREAFGHSPIEYLINLRLEKAAAMLRQSEAAISEIAMATGFGDSNYFTKMFRRKFGVSPRDYRKSARQPMSPG